MSYDLFLKPRSGQFDWSKFSDALLARSNFRVDGPQAFYENGDTGVYFSFEEREGVEEYPLLFNLNFFRPSIFALEAAPELTSLVEEFDLIVEDPQMNGMGTGEYREEKMLAGWNYGNEFACRTMPAEGAIADFGAVAMPREEIVRLWKWNLGRAALQEKEEGHYVALAMVGVVNGKPASFAVWPDAIPSIFPVVDFIVAPRDELAPRKLLRRRKDQALMTFAEARALSGRFAACSDERLTLDYADPPEEIRRSVSALPAYSGAVAAIPTGQVLDRELVPPHAM